MGRFRRTVRLVSNEETPVKPAEPEGGWFYIGLGVVAAVISGILIVLGQDTNAAEVLVYAGVAIGALGGVVLLIGCIAVGVTVGLAGARER